MDAMINIDGRDVKFRATARTPRLYRMLMMRDMILDMNKLKKAFESKKEDEDLNLSPEILQIFEDTAYVMARHANPDMEEKTADEWLDTFNIFSIYDVLPQLLELWALNTLTTSTPKKK